MSAPPGVPCLLVTPPPRPCGDVWPTVVIRPRCQQHSEAFPLRGLVLLQQHRILTLFFCASSLVLLVLLLLLLLMRCAVRLGQLHYERDLGVPIDVIDPRNYLLPKKPVPVPPEDEALLNWREGDDHGSGACWVNTLLASAGAGAGVGFVGVSLVVLV